VKGKIILGIAVLVVLLVPLAGFVNGMRAKLELINATSDACQAGAGAYGYMFGGGSGDLTDAQNAAAEVFRQAKNLPAGSMILVSLTGDGPDHALVCRGTARIRIFPFLPEVVLNETSVAAVR
jgi:hypothetical protein